MGKNEILSQKGLDRPLVANHYYGRNPVLNHHILNESVINEVQTFAFFWPSDEVRAEIKKHFQGRYIMRVWENLDLTKDKVQYDFGLVENMRVASKMVVGEKVVLWWYSSNLVRRIAHIFKEFGYGKKQLHIYFPQEHDDFLYIFNEKVDRANVAAVIAPCVDED